MRHYHSRSLAFIGGFLPILLTLHCLALYDKFNGVTVADIQKRGRLLAITSYGPNSYFLYRGAPMGYEYELLNLLAKDLGVKLEIVVTRDLDNIMHMLNSREGDIVAANLTVTSRRSQDVQFTDHLTFTRQVLVQRKPGYKPAGRPNLQEIPVVRNSVDLIGKKVYVRENSAYYQRLRNLSEEIGGEIDIIKVSGGIITEELMKKVSTGEIDFTVADESTALINQWYYPGLDVETPISFSQRIAWVVRNESPDFLKFVNAWIARMKTSVEYQIVYNRYYRDPRQYVERTDSPFSSVHGSKISQYDDLFRKHAKIIGWDWKLLAALAYQESRFTPLAVSWSGAMGVMQLMPQTAAQFGIHNIYDGPDNIRVGVVYLKWLDEYWKEIQDPGERLKFVIGSYNAGIGHVEDARKLALKNGRRKDVWFDNVELSLLDLQKPQYFNDEDVQFGYCRGEEPYAYVREILDRRDHYTKLIH